MKRASNQWFLVFLVFIILITMNVSCGRIMHFLNPQPPQSEVEILVFAGKITRLSTDKYFIFQDIRGDEWKIWVNEDTAFHASQYVNFTQPIEIIQELLDTDTEKVTFRFEDLRPEEQYVVEGQVKVPAMEGKPGEMLALSVFKENVIKLVAYSIFYNNTVKDPNMLDCSKVYPLGRMADENATYEEILLLLFEGPTEEEKKQGYVSAIPDDVVINFIVRNDGIMQVDFKPFQIAGACATAAFAAQVKQTLLAIPGTKEVIISIMNETEGILQP